jgi:hypothetical protein
VQGAGNLGGCCGRAADLMVDVDMGHGTGMLSMASEMSEMA